MENTSYFSTPTYCKSLFLATIRYVMLFYIYVYIYIYIFFYVIIKFNNVIMLNKLLNKLYN